MSLRFRYRTAGSSRPPSTASGRTQRPRPIIGVSIIGPASSWTVDGLLDSGADDTVLPDRLAALLGVDLATAPTLTAVGVGGTSQVIHLAEVTLRLGSSTELREWKAWVGFTSATLRFPLLGFIGFLEFFTVAFHGDQEEVELTVNSLYRGS